MGARGGLAGQPGIGRPRRDGARPALLPSIRPIAPVPAPRAPAGLGPDGRAVWKNTWQSVPTLDPERDRQIVTELARLSDQMRRYRDALDTHGAVISEVICSPRGDIVGNRLVANPASVQLRNALTASMAIYAALGLSPQARARLPR
jgi:P27 family predicted phage terminase small subunit